MLLQVFYALKCSMQCCVLLQPDIVMYNAGTDILDGDPLGHMQVSAAGIAARDAAVFEAARGAQTPVCMVLSGGYAKGNAAVIADSIANLITEFNLGAN